MSKMKTINIFDRICYYFEKLYNCVCGKSSEILNIVETLNIPRLLNSLEDFESILDNHPDKEHIQCNIKQFKHEIEFFEKHCRLYSDIDLGTAINSIRCQMEIYQEIKKQILVSE